jgi:threonine/homoserine/homoserine lactone efflux protein
MIPENYLIFLQIIIFMFVTPGAPRVLIMSQSLNYGFGKSLWTAFGDISANSLQMILVLFGFAALIKLFPDVVIYFKWSGILYLLYIAYGYIKSKSNINISNEVKQKSISALYMDGFLIAFLSPKATVFFCNSVSNFFNCWT